MSEVAAVERHVGDGVGVEHGGLRRGCRVECEAVGRDGDGVVCGVEGELDGERVETAGRDGDVIDAGFGEAGRGDGEPVVAEREILEEELAAGCVMPLVWTPVAELVAVMEALATAAPVGSRMAPLMPPRKVCAWAVAKRKRMSRSEVI